MDTDNFYYGLNVEFYEYGAVKTYITSNYFTKEPKNAKREFPKMIAFKIWFKSQPVAEFIESDIKNKILKIDYVRRLYSATMAEHFTTDILYSL